jgi:hypothetical protein
MVTAGSSLMINHIAQTSTSHPNTKRARKRVFGDARHRSAKGFQGTISGRLFSGLPLALKRKKLELSR